MYPHAKEHRRLPPTSTNWQRALGDMTAQKLQKDPACLHLDLHWYPPELWDNTILSFKVTRLVELHKHSLKKLIQMGSEKHS